MKEPSYQDASRCIAIRKRSKQGALLSDAEFTYCARMQKQYPEWYRKTEERVFNETVPFGSKARWGSKTDDDEQEASPKTY